MPAASPSPFLHTAASAPRQKTRGAVRADAMPRRQVHDVAITAEPPCAKLGSSRSRTLALRRHHREPSPSRSTPGVATIDAVPSSPQSHHGDATVPPKPARRRRLRCTDLCTKAEPQHYDRALRPATALFPPRHSATSPVPRRSSMKPQPPRPRPRRAARRAATSRHLVASPRQHLALHRHPLFAATNGESPKSLAHREYRDPPWRRALPCWGNARAELFRS